MKVQAALCLAGKVEQVVFDNVAPLGFGKGGVWDRLAHARRLDRVVGRLEEKRRLKAVLLVHVGRHQGVDDDCVGRVQRQDLDAVSGLDDVRDLALPLRPQRVDNEQRPHVILLPVDNGALRKQGPAGRRELLGVLQHVCGVHAVERSRQGLAERDVGGEGGGRRGGSRGAFSEGLEGTRRGDAVGGFGCSGGFCCCGCSGHCE